VKDFRKRYGFRLKTEGEQIYWWWCKGYGQHIYFDENERTENGKWIPLEKETGLPHGCQ